MKNLGYVFIDYFLYYFPSKIVQFLRIKIAIQQKSCSIPNIIELVGLWVFKPIDLDIKLSNEVFSKHNSIEHLYDFMILY